jgi:phosphoenolpyruvate---glycerone phosphotransferase subunit DhaL
MADTLDRAGVVGWLAEAARVIAAERDQLGELDAAIGDGDHGVNMDRGLQAVVAAFADDQDSPPGRLLILAGRTLVSKVGGASGPLWGSALRRAGRALEDNASLDGAHLADALDAMLAAIVDLGSAEPGDKTMVDALTPAVQMLRERLTAGDPLPQALGAAADAADAGATATIPLQARKGRASYLGERSIGHQDPGATSTALILRALADVVAGA